MTFDRAGGILSNSWFLPSCRRSWRLWLVLSCITIRVRSVLVWAGLFPFCVFYLPVYQGKNTS